MDYVTATTDRWKNARVLRLHRLRRRLRSLPGSQARTWCRICGQPVVLHVPRRYRDAVQYFYELDDTPMAHQEGGHAETGGWGVHWRLDDVLVEAFGAEHHRETEVPYWPVPPWYYWPDTPGHAEMLSSDDAIAEELVCEGRVVTR